MDTARYAQSVPVSIVVRVLIALAAPGAVTLMAIPEEHPPIVVIALLFVLAILIAARIGGAVSGGSAALLSFLSLNFFFTPPIHTFLVETISDLVALLVFLGVSVTVGLLLSSAVKARSSVERREVAARLVNRLATRLLSGDPPDRVLKDFSEGLCTILHLVRCEILTPIVGDVIVVGLDDGGHRAEYELRAGSNDVGLMTIWSSSKLSVDEDDVARSLATQLAFALEGMRLSRDVRSAEIEAHSNRLKAALFSGVTHDVKTPLGAILTSVTSLIDGRDFSNEERWDHLDTIRQEAERLHRLVNNLLDVGRLRSGALVATKVPSPIDELLESVINRLRPLLQGRDVELRVSEDLPDVPMDVVQIDQVATNLLENAAKFTPQGTPISVVAVGDGDHVRVTVTDSGPGIPKEDRLRIFQPFERGSSTESGTGLGLAVADAIVQAHGGRMWVSQSPAGGAAFTFDIPVEDIPLEEVSRARTGARS